VNRVKDVRPRCDNSAGGADEAASPAHLIPTVAPTVNDDVGAATSPADPAGVTVIREYEPDSAREANALLVLLGGIDASRVAPSSSQRVCLTCGGRRFTRHGAELVCQSCGAVLGPL